MDKSKLLPNISKVADKHLFNNDNNEIQMNNINQIKIHEILNQSPTNAKKRKVYNLLRTNPSECQRRITRQKPKNSTKKTTKINKHIRAISFKDFYYDKYQ